jgi:hypothetical protein
MPLSALPVRAAPAFMPASEAVGSVAAFRISFFQISGRMGVVTCASKPPSVSACVSLSAPSTDSPANGPTYVGPTPGCATLPSSRTVPLLYVTPATIWAGS